MALMAKDTVRVIGVQIEEGREGLFYATSQDLPGLFVGAPTLDELYDEIPQVIKMLLEHALGETVAVLPASQSGEHEHAPHLWAAVRPHMAAAALRA
jgi:predicted RNase H-like HicB family nuclease